MTVRFEKRGRTFQICIDTADNLREVLDLDVSLWMATSAPTAAFRCDPKFLGFVDTDQNGRIHSDELKDAIAWLFAHLADDSRVADDLDSLPLAAIRDDTGSDSSLVRSARYVLHSLKKEDEDAIGLADVRTFMANVKSRPLNGDGIIVPAAAPTPEIARFITDIMAAVGASGDAGGGKGITEQHLQAFVAAIPAYLDWAARGVVPEGADKTECMPFGARTPGLHGIIMEHAAQVDLFFSLCRLVRFDPRTAEKAAGPADGVAALNPGQLDSLTGYMQGMPVAAPVADGRLPLDPDAVNPLYSAWIVKVRDILAPAILGSRDALTESEWDRMKRSFAPYEAYLGEKKGPALEQVSADALRSYLDPKYAAAARKLVAADTEVATILTAVTRIEKLLLYHRHLIKLANNFVSFPDLYATGRRALFELGSLVMDGRWFHFAVRAENIPGHMAIAKQSHLLVMYLEITEKPGGAKFQIAVPAVSGTRGNLAVGKRGVFYDTTGKHYDARVVQLIENPVSLQEALVAPFVRLWSLAEGKIESWSGGAEKKLRKQFDKAITAPTGAGTSPQRPAPGAAASSSLGSAQFVGLGMVVAALGSSFAFAAKTLSSMQPHHVLFGLLAAAVLVMLPLTIIAVLKLRRQDLSALLEGNGWAVNARMRLDRAQRGYFTRRMPFPKGAEGTPSPNWLRWVLFGLLLVLLIVALQRASIRYMEARQRRLDEQKKIEQAAPAQPPAAPKPPAKGG